MTDRERILAAFRPEGTTEFRVAGCYEQTFIRDHWEALTNAPWWWKGSGIVEHERAWAEDYVERSGLGWVSVGACPSRAERASRRYEVRGPEVWLVHDDTGSEERLTPPSVSGVNTSLAESRHTEPGSLPTSETAVDALIPERPAFDPERFLAEGRHDVAAAFRSNLDVVLYGAVLSPFWSLYNLLGYEGMMLFVAQDRQLAAYAAERILRNLQQRISEISALGADAVWIEECLSDQISPKLFAETFVPILQRCVEEIRSAGLKSIYYYGGDPNGRFDALFEVGADALHFEESKKGFTIDIEDVVRRTDGRCVVFGNLDSVGTLQDGCEDDVRAEVERQLAAGGASGGRFVMDTGSPVTPGTPVDRVRRFTDMVRELAAR